MARNLTPITVTTQTYCCTAPPDPEPLREQELNLAPIEIDNREESFAFPYAGPDIRLLQKRAKVAALDLRFQRYRKAEP